MLCLSAALQKAVHEMNRTFSPFKENEWKPSCQSVENEH